MTCVTSLPSASRCGCVSLSLCRCSLRWPRCFPMYRSCGGLSLSQQRCCVCTCRLQGNHFAEASNNAIAAKCDDEYVAASVCSVDCGAAVHCCVSPHCISPPTCVIVALSLVPSHCVCRDARACRFASHGLEVDVEPYIVDGKMQLAHVELLL